MDPGEEGEMASRTPGTVVSGEEGEMASRTPGAVASGEGNGGHVCVFRFQNVRIPKHSACML